jgi:hypothetical protein
LYSHSHPPRRNSVSQESFSIRHSPPGNRSSRPSDRPVLAGVLAQNRLPDSSPIRPLPSRLVAGPPIRTSSASDPSPSPQETACPSHPGGRLPWSLQQPSASHTAPKSIRQPHRYVIIATRNDAPLRRSSAHQRPRQTCVTRPTRPLQHRHDPAPAGPSSMPMSPSSCPLTGPLFVASRPPLATQRTAAAAARYQSAAGLHPPDHRRSHPTRCPSVSLHPSFTDSCSCPPEHRPQTHSQSHPCPAADTR